MAKKSDYFGLGRLVSLILAIIPITSLVCGVITRFTEGKNVAALIRLLVGWNIFWVRDLVCMVLGGMIWRILNI